MTNVFGYDSNNIFDQSLNTDDSVTFNKVTLTAPTANDTDAATKLYVDTHGGGGGGGNMTYTGTTPATNYIYKAYATDGHDAIKSSITDNGSIVTVQNQLKCISITKIGDRLWKGLWDKVEDGIYGQVFLPIRDQVWLEIDNPKKLKIKKWKG